MGAAMTPEVRRVVNEDHYQSQKKVFYPPAYARTQWSLHARLLATKRTGQEAISIQNSPRVAHAAFQSSQKMSIMGPEGVYTLFPKENLSDTEV